MDMDKLMQVNSLLAQLKTKGHLFCPNCGGKVKMNNLTFKQTEKADMPFIAEFLCKSCGREFEIEGIMKKGEFVPLSGTIREYGEQGQ